MDERIARLRLRRLHQIAVDSGFRDDCRDLLSSLKLEPDLQSAPPDIREKMMNEEQDFYIITARTSDGLLHRSIENLGDEAFIRFLEEEQARVTGKPTAVRKRHI